MPRLGEFPGWMLRQLPYRARVAVLVAMAVSVVAVIAVTLLVILPALPEARASAGVLAAARSI